MVSIEDIPMWINGTFMAPLAPMGDHAPAKTVPADLEPPSPASVKVSFTLRDIKPGSILNNVIRSLCRRRVQCPAEPVPSCRRPETPAADLQLLPSSPVVPTAVNIDTSFVPSSSDTAITDQICDLDDNTAFPDDANASLLLQLPGAPPTAAAADSDTPPVCERSSSDAITSTVVDVDNSSSGYASSTGSATAADIGCASSGSGDFPPFEAARTPYPRAPYYFDDATVAAADAAAAAAAAARRAAAAAAPAAAADTDTEKTHKPTRRGGRAGKAEQEKRAKRAAREAAANQQQEEEDDA